MYYVDDNEIIEAFQLPANTNLDLISILFYKQKTVGIEYKNDGRYATAFSNYSFDFFSKKTDFSFFIKSRKRLFAVNSFVANNDYLISEIDAETFKKKTQLFKKTSILNYDVRKPWLWIAEIENTFLVVTMLKNYIYLYNKNIEMREKKLSLIYSSNYPYVILDMPPFQNSPRNSRKNSFVIQERAFNLKLENAGNSETLFFGRVGEEHFVYACSTPDYIDGVLVGSHAVFRFFDLQLKPVGPPIHRFGQIAGANEKGVYVFYPDGPVPPVTEAGTKEHYGIDAIRSKEDQRRILKKFRSFSTRVLQPVIEIVPPPNT